MPKGPKMRKKYQEDAGRSTPAQNFNDDSDNELPDNMNQDIDLSKKSLKYTQKDSDYQMKQKREALPMGSIMSDILNKDLSQRKYKANIFTDKKQSIKSVSKSQKEAKLLAIKRHLKKKAQNTGRTLPTKSGQSNYERALKIVAVEGITKMFNAMANIQKESLDQVLKMALDDKIGAGAKRRVKRGIKKGGRGSNDKFLNRKF